MAKKRFSRLEIEDASGTEATANAPRPDAAAYMDRAKRHVLAGRHDKAIAAYTAALRENPLLVDAWVGQLWMLLDLGEYPEARLWADKALAHFPDHPDLQARNCLAAWRAGRRKVGRDLNVAALE